MDVLAMSQSLIILVVSVVIGTLISLVARGPLGLLRKLARVATWLGCALVIALGAYVYDRWTTPERPHFKNMQEVMDWRMAHIDDDNPESKEFKAGVVEYKRRYGEEPWPLLQRQSAHVNAYREKYGLGPFVMKSPTDIFKVMPHPALADVPDEANYFELHAAAQKWQHDVHTSKLAVARSKPYTLMAGSKPAGAFPTFTTMAECEVQKGRMQGLYPKNAKLECTLDRPEEPT